MSHVKTKMRNNIRGLGMMGLSGTAAVTDCFSLFFFFSYAFCHWAALDFSLSGTNILPQENFDSRQYSIFFCIEVI